MSLRALILAGLISIFGVTASAEAQYHVPQKSQVVTLTTGDSTTYVVSRREKKKKHKKHKRSPASKKKSKHGKKHKKKHKKHRDY
jgi:hypothetical protein